MKHPLNRRDFMQDTTSLLGLGALAMTPLPSLASSLIAPRNIKKAVKIGMVQGDLSLQAKFQLLMDLGFDGIELDSPNDLDVEEVIAARDATNIDIHGVVCSTHWQYPLSHADESVRAKCVAGMTTALHDAKAYGSTSVLLVPAVVNKTISYAQAWDLSIQEIHKLVPLAEELDIQIAFENVWNQFLLSPLEAARYVDEFDSKHVGWYFDVGNVINYGWPEQWIEILGDRIFKLDIKEYSRTKRNDEGLWKGFGVDLLKGDCDWPSVMAALDKIGYSGWATAEIRGGDEARLREIAQRMDTIFAS
ncbi:MAG: sugar phosphate isomerase/epimerase [Planctomycetota bacterium]|nr:sugar phosphate isomerase/epimerase [Planctomycetota bacterium]